MTNEINLTENAIAKAREAIKTLYLISDGFRADIEKAAKAATDPTDAAIIHETLLPQLDSIDFLVSIIQEALEGSDNAEE